MRQLLIASQTRLAARLARLAEQAASPRCLHGRTQRDEVFRRCVEIEHSRVRESMAAIDSFLAERSSTSLATRRDLQPDEVGIERRFTAAPAAIAPVTPARRSRSAGSATRVKGLAALFSDGTAATEYDLAGDGSVVEQISPRAFDKSLQAIREGKSARGVVATFQHSLMHPLAHTANNSLLLETTKRGLAYEFQAPDDVTFGKDLVAMVRRGLARSASFSFLVTDDEWSRDGSRLVRTLLDLDLFEIGVLTTGTGAYPGASAYLS